MANEYQGWKGAVEPAESSPSGNEIQLWRGAVEPTEPVGGLSIIIAAYHYNHHLETMT